MKIYDLQVNHLTNPLGFLMRRTVFSWKVKEAAGKKQAAARVVVSADEGQKNVLFDSGWDEAADSLGYKAEVELSARTRYFWTVAVRTDAGEEETSEVQWFETAKMDEAWSAEWISCSNDETRLPIFEKEIRPAKTVESARLYICGLGLYEASYDGRRIGGEYLTPYSNDYDEWVQYQTYDVTQELGQAGTLSVMLGNGWYKGRFGFSSREEKGFFGDSYKLIAELRISYADGTEEVIGTDEGWNVRRSNLTYATLYDGEHRDDTLPELTSEKAVSCEAPKGGLTARMSLPVTVHETFAPVELIHTPAGELVLGMGQEITGIFKLRVNVPAGTTVHVQTGEILQQGNFYNDNLRSAKSEYYYVSNGNEIDLVPHFTFYGYRYVKIEGIPDLKKEDFTGLTLYSGITDKGTMKTGHALLNQFLSNVRWGLKDNFVDVPTDCPQRDERMGWTGDAQVFSATATYLEDTYAFYAKYLYDMKQEQKSKDGKVPDVIPSCGVDSSACVWGDASCIIPWNLYLFYGDKSILEDQFSSMKDWVDYIRKVDGDDHGWRHVFHYGDWLALDHPNMSAEQVLGGTDEEFIANVYYAASAELVSKAARVLGHEKEAEEYKKLSEEQFDEVRKEYYSVTGRCCIKTQTALLLTLKYGLSDNVEYTRKTLRKLYVENGNKLKTGFVGTPLMCNILSDNGMEDIAWKLLLNEDYPGWLHEVKLGATTVWERWNSVLDDGSISGTGMNSLNHYSYGSVVEWMYRHVAGIQATAGTLGFKEVTFTPSYHWDLKEQQTEYDSPAGLYKSAWKILDETHVELTVEVPFGCRATICLPLADVSVYEEKENPIFADVRDGICHLEPGVYTVSYQTVRPLKTKYSTDTPIQELFENGKVKEALGKMFPVEMIPMQYQSMSIKDLGAQFGQEMSDEQLAQLDAMLAQF